MREIRKLLLTQTGKIFRFIAGKGLGKIPLFTTIHSYFYWHLRPEGIILLDIQGSKLYADSRDTGITPFLLQWGFYEKYETELFKKLVKKRMIVADVGANIGYYTLLASRLVGEEGKVFAFEPDPHNFDLLCKNVKLNECKNVVPVKKAVFSKSGQTKLFLDKKNLGGHSLSEANVDKVDFLITNVTSLDDYFKNIGYKIDMIKMDVQGAEMGILGGMTNIIDQNNDLTIITEFWPLGIRNCGFSPRDFLNKLVAHGYTLYQIGPAIEPVEIECLLKMCVNEKFVTLLCKKDIDTCD